MAKHYYISFNSTDFTEIFPVNNPVGTTMQPEGTRIWREEVDELRLPQTTNSTVYTTLHSYFIDKTKFDTEIEIEIYTGTKTAGVLYWKGLFSISDTVDNFQNTVAVLDPLRINDEYRTILEKADIQYELDVLTTILETKRLGYSEDVSVAGAWTNPGVGYLTAYATFIAAGGSILTGTTGGLDNYGATIGVGGLTNNDILVIEVESFSLGAGATPTFDIQAGAGNASMTDEGAKSIATGTHAWTAASTQAAPRIAIETPASTNIKMEFTARKVQTANDMVSGGEQLMTFIENFLDTATHMFLTGYTGNVVSTFINNDALPTGAPSSIDTFITANPNGNYVTETTDNELNPTIIGLLRKWFTLTDPPSFKMSFNDIMAQLRESLQIYWFIDADSKFRIEHEKYFVKQVEDSTPIVLQSPSEVDAREFKYNKGRIASVEQFSWAQSSNRDFNGEDIIYNNFETTNNALEHSVGHITTDIKYVKDNPDDASNSGLGLYQCNLLTGITGADIYEINISTGALTSSAFSNAAFSWANLHEKYWSWSRMSENATINSSTAIAIDSSIRFLEQGNVKFFYSTAIDPYTAITSTLTGGAPIEIRRDLETDYITMILGYDPYKL